MVQLPPPPPPPRSPSLAARRLIFRYTGKQGLLLVMGACFTLVSFGLVAMICVDMPGELALTLDHAKTQGTVLEAYVDTSVEVNEEYPTQVRFRYAIDGKQLEGKSAHLGVDPSAFAVGSTVDIQYVPSYPEWARLRGGTYGSIPLWGAFVLIFPIAAVSLLVSTVRSNRREIHAFCHGEPVSGQVTFAGPDVSASLNRQHPMKVEWSFEVLGITYQGNLSNMNYGLLQHLKVGEKVTVLYEPSNPTINTLWVE